MFKQDKLLVQTYLLVYLGTDIFIRIDMTEKVVVDIKANTNTKQTNDILEFVDADCRSLFITQCKYQHRR